MAKQKELKCNECSQSFTARQNLFRHKKNFHSAGPSMISCRNCDKKFSRQEHLVRHQPSCKGRISLNCIVCGKIFTRKNNLNRHLKICEKIVEKKKTKLENIKKNKRNKTLVSSHTEFERKMKLNYDSYELEESMRDEVDFLLIGDRFGDEDMPASMTCDDSWLFANDYDSTDVPPYPQSMPLVNQTETDLTATDIAPDELPPSQSMPLVNQTETDLTATDIAPDKLPPSQSMPLVNQTETDLTATDIAPDELPPSQSMTTPVNQQSNSSLPRHLRRRLAKELTSTIKSWNIGEDQMMEVLSLSLKQLGLSCSIRNNYSNSGQKGLSMQLKKSVWQFWHDNSIESTLTTRLAKLRTSKKPRLHAGLSYVDTVNVVNYRKSICFYESIWHITTKTVRELFHQYLREYPTCSVSYGTFLYLKPFYVRSASKSDMEICCCKLHLHARWVVDAIIKLFKKSEISGPEFTSYESFLSSLCSECPKDPITYISWDCAQNKDELCSHVLNKLEEFLFTFSKLDPLITIPFNHFEMVEHSSKSGNISKHLTSVTTMANNDFLQSFLNKLLPKIVYHRNLLKNYRNVVQEFNDFFDCINIDIDFSENLSIPVKNEPQTLHWHHEQVSVHSAICKFNGEKMYIAHFSDDTKHDQSFVNLCINDVLSYTEKNKDLIIHSDNCKSQYKSAQHFFLMQKLANELNQKIIRVFGVANHGKGEVDHVGGLAKVAIRSAVASGYTFHNSADMVEYLCSKSKNQNGPHYVYKEILPENLEEARAEARLVKCKTITGCDKFQVIIFTPKSDEIKAASRLCLCAICKVEYGTCDLFLSYSPVVQYLNKVSLRYSQEETSSLSSSHSKLTDMLSEDVIIAVAADDKSLDDIWFIQFKQFLKKDYEVVDDYGHSIPVGIDFMSGHFLERDSSSLHSTTYKLSKKVTYFYKESVIYPFVHVEFTKKGIRITNSELTNIHEYIQEYGFSPF